MSRKAVIRLRERSWRDEPAAERWAAAHEESAEEYARALDPALWKEACSAADALHARADEVLPPLGVRLGGGGHYPLLHFLIRHRRPEVVVETGVAAGYSSQAMLTALALNGDGRLYSSDFPYFRLEDPQRYIGALVEPELRDRWTLRIRGDRVNLPEIVREVRQIDLFHYDSDKPVDGRRFALNLVMPRMSADGVILMDDIQDNGFFRDYVAEHNLPFRVFGFDGKYVGAIGLPEPERG
jgi:predicted O-methyltransferase YrrM